MFVNRTGISHHPVPPVADDIRGVDEHPEIDATPSPPPQPEPDRFQGSSNDALNRLAKGGHKVSKTMLKEFIYTPQALYIGQPNNSTTTIPWGSIAVRTEQNIYRATDSFVSDSEIRTVITQQMQSADFPEVVWTENAGIVEVGAGMYGTITLPVENPTGLGIAFNFGFDAMGLMAYRIVKPIPIAKGKNIYEAHSGISMELPWDIPGALKLSRGTEVQFVGRGKLSAFEGLIIYEGATLPGLLGVTTPGVAFYPIANQEISKEYSLKVLALDGKGKMRVTIEKIHRKSAGLTLRLLAGLLDPTNNALPQVGSGLLSYICQTAIENPMQNMLMNVWTISINASLSVQGKENVLYCFDLDLNNIEHHKAYTDLMRLNVGEAMNLSAKKGAGVSKVEWHEKKHRIKRSLDMRVFAQQLLLKEASKAKRTGNLIRPDDSEVSYCDLIYRKKFLNFLTGHKEFRWQSIQLYDKDARDTKTYFAFLYQDLDRSPRQKQVSRFFAFAKYLAIISDIEVNSKLIHLSKRKRLTSSKDDTTTNIEMYFTPEGVNNIQKSSSNDGLLAFIKSKINSDPSFTLYPEISENNSWAKDLFDYYYYLIHSGPLITRIPHRLRHLKKHHKLSNIKDDYFNNNGRDFHDDFKLYLRAKEFGHLIEKWRNATDKRNVSKFFTRIGRSHSFDYLEVLSALTELAGRENVLVHSLSMIGGEVSISSKDEGKITHPRDEAWELTNRAVP